MSEISTFPSSSKQFEKKKKESKNLVDPTRSTSQELSSENTQSYSLIKLNFQKHKLSGSQKNSKELHQEIYRSSEGKKKTTIHFKK